MDAAEFARRAERVREQIAATLTPAEGAMGAGEFQALLFDRLAALVAEQLVARAEVARLRDEIVATDTRMRGLLDELRRQATRQ